jgi:predicted nucleotidyltransferase
MVQGHILTREELKLVEFFSENLTKNYATNEVVKKLNKKSYNWVFYALKKILNLGILNCERKNSSSFYSLNLRNPLTLSYLSLIENTKINPSLPHKNILKLIESIPLRYFSFIITGSYSSGNAKKNSDLDVVVLVEKKNDCKEVLNILSNQGDLMIPKVHPFVFSKQEFLKMLLNKNENYGKEIYKNHIILFGAENFYSILREAIENGFKD